LLYVALVLIREYQEKIFGGKVVRRIFRTKTAEATGNLRKLQNKIKGKFIPVQALEGLRVARG
jgi:hypothetical protein